MDHTFLSDGTRNNGTAAIRRSAQQALLVCTSVRSTSSTGAASHVRYHTKVVENDKTVELTAAKARALIDDVLPCVPEGCRGFVEGVLRQAFADVIALGDYWGGQAERLTECGLDAALRLLEGLAPVFSIEGMFPRGIREIVRDLVNYADAMLGESPRRSYPNSASKYPYARLPKFLPWCRKSCWVILWAAPWKPVVPVSTRIFDSFC
jgi:hypothetical protein